MPIRPTEIDPDVEAAKRRIIAERAEEQARRQREREIRNAAAPVAREETPSQTALEALEIATSIRVIGVFADTYILAEADSRLYMIDQHAAHERLLYEKYNRALEKGIDMQPLLLPIVLPVSPREMAAVTDNRALLLQAGYDVEPFGERDIQVRAVPFVLGQPEVKPLFLEMLDSLDRLKAETLARRREIVAQTSCKHAVKAGDALTEAEIRALIQDMIATNAPPLCAHGRPIVKIWTLSEIEKLFKRG